MRESSIRPSVRKHKLGAILAVTGVVAPACLMVGAISGPAASVWRMVIAHASFLAALAQGSTAVAAAFTWFGGARHIRLQRSAQCLALLAVPTSLAQFALALGVRALAAEPGDAPSLLAVASPFALSLLGTAFALAPLSPDAGDALELGLTDGWLARTLASAWPNGARHARGLAIAYLVAYPILASIGVHGTLAPLGSVSHPVLLGPYVALSNAACGLAATIAIATLAPGPLYGADELSIHDSRRAGVALATLSTLLAALLFSQLIAGPGPFARFDLGLLPLDLRWSGWRAFVMLGLMVGYLAPAVMLAGRDARSTPSTVLAAGLLALFGIWTERFALTMPARAPGFSWLSVPVALGIASWAVLGVLAVMRALGAVDEEPEYLRRSVPIAIE